jgi:dihydroorotate dehydrogenase/Pyruvate/2-oxoacid:ferredoxin oxidoreductase delta subunit
MADLSTNFCGIRIKNPLVLAPGPHAGTPERIRKCIDAGYGAVFTKTASMMEYFHKYPYPRYHLVDYELSERGKGSRDWVWFHNDHNAPVGPMEFTKTVAAVSDYAREKNCLLVGTFAASSVEMWARCAEAYQQAGAGAVELNFCCPGPGSLKDITKEGDQTACFGDVLSRNIELSAKIVERVRAAVDIPILCKLPPALRLQSVEVAGILHEAGAVGFELYANSHGMRVDIEAANPVGFGCGTVNTHGHLADTMYDVAQIAKEHPEIDLMAGRGVRSWEDAVELLMAGATVVGICTATYVYSLSFGREMLSDMATFMDRKGYAGTDAMRCAALKKVLKPSEIKDKVKPLFAKVIGTKCKACGRCGDVCVYLAAQVFYKAGVGVAKIDRSRCIGCTLCSQVCPYDAIAFEERTVEEYLKTHLYGLPGIEG